MSKLVLVVFYILWCEIRGHSERFLSKHVDIADYPYHVSVRRGGQHVCSGALVHESWIITAASCVYDSSVTKITVLMGSSDLEKLSGNAYQLNVSKIVVHRTFDQKLLTNNIALLKMKPLGVRTNSSLLPIFLPSSENYHLKDGSVLVVSGWKKLQKDRVSSGSGSGSGSGSSSSSSSSSSSGGFESQLSVTGAPLVNQRTCIRSMPSYKAVSGKMLCAGYTYPNADETCQGDIGAPLANDDILVGILSSGDGCTSGRYPGIYTKISTFLPWISKILSLHS